jgi:ribosomal protein S18 acetylase RimI-like enzyme
VDDEEVSVRQLDADEYESILAVWQRAGLDTIGPEGPDSREALARQVASGAVTLLGLEVDGELAGICLVSDDGRKGWINRLAVDPSYQRRGYGPQLVQAAEQLLRRNGVRTIAALVKRENQASLALLSKAGFADASLDVHYLRKREESKP